MRRQNKKEEGEIKWSKNIIMEGKKGRAGSK